MWDAPWLDAAAEAVDRQMETDGGHDFGHLYRVLSNAAQIAEGELEDVDFDVVAAAVLFHDVVNLPKNHPERETASARSADVARSFFADLGFDEHRLDLIAEAIRCHSWSAGLTPASLEAKIVADADRLESLGAFGIARVFYISGRMGGAIVDAYDPRGESRELDDRAFARDHFELKVLKLRDRMHTVVGRREADQRHQVILDFLTQLDREMN